MNLLNFCQNSLSIRLYSLFTHMCFCITNHQWFICIQSNRFKQFCTNPCFMVHLTSWINFLSWFWSCWHCHGSFKLIICDMAWSYWQFMSWLGQVNNLVILSHVNSLFHDRVILIVCYDLATLIICALAWSYW